MDVGDLNFRVLRQPLNLRLNIARVCFTNSPHLVGAGYRVLAPGQRGYSPAARPIGWRAHVQSHLVDDVVALVDAAGAQKVHLVGHDWGALVAWALTARHPDRVHSLTAVSVPHPKAFAWAIPRGRALKSWCMGKPIASRRMVADPHLEDHVRAAFAPLNRPINTFERAKSIMPRGR